MVAGERPSVRAVNGAAGLDLLRGGAQNSVGRRGAAEVIVTIVRGVGVGSGALLTASWTEGLGGILNSVRRLWSLVIGSGRRLGTTCVYRRLVGVTITTIQLPHLTLVVVQVVA